MKTSTQFALLTFLALALTAGAAFADFVPGRVRAGLRAEMTITEATGIYQDVKSAVMTMNFEDGSSVAKSLSVYIPGRAPKTMPITSIGADHGCGKPYHASNLMNPSRDRTVIELKDYRLAMCDIMMPGIWMVEVKHYDADEIESVLYLYGNPEGVFQTL